MTQEQLIADAIRAWLDVSPRRNKSLLNRLSGVSYSSVRRAASGEAEQNSTVVIPIAKVVMTPQNFHAFVTNYYPKYSDTITMITRNETPDELAEFIDSPEHLRIIILANSRTGTDNLEVVRKYGESALPFFDDLKEAGALVCRGESWFFEGNISSTSMSQTRSLLAMMITNSDRRNDEIPKRALTVFGWESVNQETYEKLHDMECQFDKDRFALVSKPENKGEILAVYGSYLNVLKGLEKAK